MWVKEEKPAAHVSLPHCQKLFKSYLWSKLYAIYHREMKTKNQIWLFKCFSLNFKESIDACDNWQIEDKKFNLETSSSFII